MTLVQVRFDPVLDSEFEIARRDPGNSEEGAGLDVEGIGYFLH
jgi:hypothetical protein